MTGPLTRRLRIAAVVLLSLLGVGVVSACPFCGMQGQTLTQELSQASMVLFGSLTNGKPGNADAGETGATDMVIEQVVKGHPIAEGQKKITIPRYVPTSDKDDAKYLIFFDVFKGKLDPYRGMPIKSVDMPSYLQGAYKVKDKKTSERLLYFFDYLNNEDLEIANDALKEFGNSDYKDYQEVAHRFPADKVAGWLSDPKTPSYRFGLYASILGHSSKKQQEHAKLLRSLVEDPEKRASSGVDGLLAGYVMLQPKEGWDYLRGILKDNSRDFLLRYAALRSVRFFVDYRSDLIEKKDAVSAAALLLEQADIADLAIEDLRKWKCWELTSTIVALKDRESHDTPIIRRSILRFALSSTDKSAKGYVEQERKRDEQAVLDAEELLRLEQTPTKPATR